MEVGGINDVIRAVGEMPLLTVLKCGMNGPTDDSTVKLLAGLMGKLSELDLRSDLLNGGQMATLAGGLRKAPGLRVLNVAINPVGDEGLLALAGALGDPAVGLHFLNCFGCNGSDDTLEEVRAAWDRLNSRRRVPRLETMCARVVAKNNPFYDDDKMIPALIRDIIHDEGWSGRSRLSY